MTTPVLALDDVSVTYADGNTALAGASLRLDSGELVALTGRSGSGKSTLLNVAGGLVGVSGGAIRLCGHQIDGARQGALADLRRKYVGYVFQDLNLLPSLTAAENVSLPLELDGVDLATARRLAVEALGAVELGEAADRFPPQLSGGERQRVAIARGVVGDRALLLADEPTAALDELSGETVMRILRKQCDDGAAAIVVTHEPALAAWADRVVRLVDGRVEQVSTRAVDAANVVVPGITGEIR